MEVFVSAGWQQHQRGQQLEAVPAVVPHARGAADGLDHGRLQRAGALEIRARQSRE